MASFAQTSAQPKFYNRYKIFEPYFQDDWHVTSHLTLNLGVRVSLFGTYRDRYHSEYNFDVSRYVAGASSTDPVTGLVIGNPFNGVVQCGVTPGVPDSCMKGHLFNPAPRIGFAWDPARQRQDGHSRRLRRILRAHQRQRSQRRIAGAGGQSGGANHHHIQPDCLQPDRSHAGRFDHASLDDLNSQQGGVAVRAAVAPRCSA